MPAILERLRSEAAAFLLPFLAAGAGEPGATVEVTAPLPSGPLILDLDPRRPPHSAPAQDGAEFLRTVPGFGLVRKGGAGGDPVLRGMGGSRLGVLADGEETPGGCGGRMDPPTAYLFPGSFDQVQVVKGPQTVRSGPGNSAGTVLFRRLPPCWDPPGWNGTAGWSLGGWGRSDQLLEAQAGTPRVYGRAAGIRSSSGDYRSGDGREVHSRQDRWSVDGALGWTPGPRARLELRGARSDGLAAYADRGMDGVAFQRRNLGLVLELRGLPARVDRLECQAYLTDVDHVMDNVTLRSAPWAAPMARNPRRTTRGGRIEAALRPGPAGEWILGADFRSSRHDVRRSTDPWSVPVAGLSRTPDAVLDDAGLYTEWARPLGEAHRLVAGARVDRWRARDLRGRLPLGPGGMPNPTARAVRDQVLPGGYVRDEWGLARSGVTAYAGVGHTRRPPDYWELFPLEAEASPSAFGIRPERTSQLDAGASFQGARLRASVSGYFSHVADFILVQSGVLRPSPGGAPRSATVARNVQARTWGGELALGAALGGPLRAEGSLVSVWGENRTDRLPLAQIPPPEARLGLVWEAPAWSAGSRVRMVAPQDRFAPGQGTIAGQDLGRTPGFAVFSLDGEWRPVRAKALHLRFGIDNLFDRAYAEHLSRQASSIPGYPAPTLRIQEPGRLLWAAAAMRLD